MTIPDDLRGDYGDGQVLRPHHKQGLATAPRNASLIDGAPALLGIVPGERRLQAKLKALVAEDPDNQEREADLLAAYWLVADWDAQGSEEGHAEYLATAEKQLAESVKAKSEADNDTWPAQWPPAFHEVWKSQGGTMASDKAWADAGLPSATALTEPQLSGY